MRHEFITLPYSFNYFFLININTKVSYTNEVLKLLYLVLF